MGLRCEIDVEDWGFLTETPMLGYPVDYSEGLQIFCDTFMDEATAYCPVDTGYLRSTLTAENDGFTWAECYTDCEYAEYQEYGTWCMRAQPYFTPAIQMALDAALPVWIEAWNEAMEEEKEELKHMQEEAEAAAEEAENNAAMMRGILAIIYLLLVALIQAILNIMDDLMSGHDDAASRTPSVTGFDIEII